MTTDTAANNELADTERWGSFAKSSFSGANGCIAVAISSRGNVRIQDSKSAGSATLHFNRQEWVAFLAGVRSGEFELPPQ